MADDFQRRRPAGVIVLAVLAVLGGLLSLGMVAMMAHAPQPKPPMLPADIVFCAVAAWAFVNAAGLSLLHRWARLSVIVFQSQATLGLGVAAIVVVGLSFSNSLPPQGGPALMVVAAIFLILMAVGIWSIVYLNNRSVAAQFLPSGTPAARLAERRPFLVSAIAGFMVYSGVLSIIMSFGQTRAFVIATALHGTPVIIYYIIYGLAFFASGILLWRLRPGAWQIASGVLFYVVANVVLMYVTPAGQAMMREVQDNALANASPQAAAMLPTMFKYGFLAGAGGIAVINAILIAILVWKRAAFRPVISLPET